MGPMIGRSIGQGFRAANHSWPGMLVYAACGIVIGLILIGLVRLTDVPEELLRPPTFEGAAMSWEQEAFAQPAPDTAEQPEATAPSQTEPAAESEPLDEEFTDDETMNELETDQLLDEEPWLEEDWAAFEEDLGVEQEQVLLEWLGRAWPVLLIAFLMALVAGVWLYGGQVGYLATRIRGTPTGVSTFWQSGTQAFGSLLVASLLAFAAVLGASLLVAALGFVLSLLPPAVGGALGILLILALVAALAWLIVRVAFWAVAIVVDRLSPIAGLRASFRVTKGRWSKTFGLVALAALITMGAGLPFALLEAVGNLMEGTVGRVIVFLINFVGSLVGVYIGFATTAAYIRFYEDAKGTPTSTVMGGPTSA